MLPCLDELRLREFSFAALFRAAAINCLPSITYQDEMRIGYLLVSSKVLQTIGR
jgi:hypothetical protein